MELEAMYPAKVWKFCPFCGSNEIVWEGTHKTICKKCNKSFFINAVAALIALIMNPKGELLLVRRKNDPQKGTLDLPGGFADLLETAENTAIREIKEELGIDVTEVKYYTSVPNRYLYGGIVYFTMDLVFICKVNDMTNISANDDISDFVFKPIDEINVDEIGLESVKSLITSLKKDKLFIKNIS